MWKFLLPFAAFVALVVLFAFGLNPNRDIHALPSPLIGKPAPEFSLSDVMDETRIVTNAALKGQVYVLNVWASWCLPCRQEHEELLTISRTKTVPIIGLDYMDQREKAKLLLQQLGNPYSAVPYDKDGRVAIDWGVTGVPETFVIDSKGIVRVHYAGPLNDEALARLVLPALK